MALRKDIVIQCGQISFKIQMYMYTIFPKFFFRLNNLTTLVSEEYEYHKAASAISLSCHLLKISTLLSKS